MSSRSDGRRHAPERGFTLLETLCAFAILALTTGYLTTIFVQNIDQGTDALDRRELREAADTIFRKMIYEHQEYKDGESRTLDDEYGEFARLRGYRRDRWAIYTFHLEKKEETVVGPTQPGEDSIFGDETQADRDLRETEDSDGTQATGRQLTRLTLSIYRTDEPSEEPLFVLTTRIDPRKAEESVR